MTSSVPRGPDDRRIIPWRPRGESLVEAYAESTQHTLRDREDAARHYLKFMLPSIPIATFILTFMLCSVLLGIPAGGHASVAGQAHTLSLDPTLPFLGALLLSLITGALCVWIYFGYLRVSGVELRPRTR